MRQAGADRSAPAPTRQDAPGQMFAEAFPLVGQWANTDKARRLFSFRGRAAQRFDRPGQIVPAFSMRLAEVTAEIRSDGRAKSL